MTEHTLNETIDNATIELDDVQARHENPKTVIYEEIDWALDQYSHEELIQAFKEHVELELDPVMSLADIKHEVRREAVRQVSSKVLE